MLTISRAIEGISLNGTETLLDGNNKPMLFNTKEEAKEYLKENGYSSWTDEDMENTFNFEYEIAEPLIPMTHD